MRFTFLVLACVLTPSIASAYCSEPSSPYCADRFGKFDDEYDFQRCRSEMESYSSDVEMYVSCIVREAENDRSKAINAYNDAVESFNRRARSDY